MKQSYYCPATTSISVITFRITSRLRDNKDGSETIVIEPSTNMWSGVEDIVIQWCDKAADETSGDIWWRVRGRVKACPHSVLGD